MASVAAIPPRRARILMLHGWTQNAALFTEKAAAFRRKLRDVADLFFAEAPHAVAPGVASGRENARAWWSIIEGATAPQEDAAAGESTPGEADVGTSPPPIEAGGIDITPVFRRRFVGWDESRALLAQLWEAHGPFDGVAGFSQGAVAVHQLVYEAQGWADGSITPPPACAPIADAPPRFAILVCGFPSALAVQDASPGARDMRPAAPLLRLPSLHFVAQGDHTVPPPLQTELAAAFADPVVLSTEKGHAMPQRAPELAAVAQFVRERMQVP